jgi:hypothetical protein
LQNTSGIREYNVQDRGNFPKNAWVLMVLYG